jgi:hypothetical protein
MSERLPRITDDDRLDHKAPIGKQGLGIKERLQEVENALMDAGGMPAMMTLTSRPSMVPSIGASRPSGPSTGSRPRESPDGIIDAPGNASEPDSPAPSRAPSHWRISGPITQLDDG